MLRIFYSVNCKAFVNLFSRALPRGFFPRWIFLHFSVLNKAPREQAGKKFSTMKSVGNEENSNFKMPSFTHKFLLVRFYPQVFHRFMFSPCGKLLSYRNLTFPLFDTRNVTPTQNMTFFAAKKFCLYFFDFSFV